MIEVTGALFTGNAEEIRARSGSLLQSVTVSVADSAAAQRWNCRLSALTSEGHITLVALFTTASVAGCLDRVVLQAGLPGAVGWSIQVEPVAVDANARAEVRLDGSPDLLCHGVQGINGTTLVSPGATYVPLVGIIPGDITLLAGDRVWHIAAQGNSNPDFQATVTVPVPGGTTSINVPLGGTLDLYPDGAMVGPGTISFVNTTRHLVEVFR